MNMIIFFIEETFYRFSSIFHKILHSFNFQKNYYRKKFERSILVESKKKEKKKRK